MQTGVFTNVLQNSLQNDPWLLQVACFGVGFKVCEGSVWGLFWDALGAFVLTKKYNPGLASIRLLDHMSPFDFHIKSIYNGFPCLKVMLIRTSCSMMQMVCDRSAFVPRYYRYFHDVQAEIPATEHHQSVNLIESSRSLPLMNNYI